MNPIRCHSGLLLRLIGPKLLQPPAEAAGSATSTKSGDENHFKVPGEEIVILNAKLDG